KHAVAKFLLVRLGEIAVAHCLAANADLARGCGWINKFNLNTSHRPAHQTVLKRCAFLVVANSAAFRCAVKGMDRLFEFLAKRLRHRKGERCYGRNAQPKSWKHGDIIYFLNSWIQTQ